MKNTLYILTLCFSLLIIATSCKKEENKTDPSTSSSTSGTSNYCYANQGKFEIDINGENFIMTPDSNTNFTILYNWFGLQESNFVISSNDQNNNSMSVETALPGTLNVGSTTYDAASLSPTFFTIYVDTFVMYVSTVTFDVTSSNLDLTDGIYKPVSATFTGVAHSYPWINGQPPVDTVNISGTFCLNGVVIP
ncbi:MAG: hypothetical protein COA33_010660 [Fluviicola sp.]|nr:hypothetical protein [Fluviicola sp.]